MGQAKKRGSFEQRVKESIEKVTAKKKVEAQAELDAWNALTPEQQAIAKATRKNARQVLSFMAGFADGKGRL